MPKERQSQSEEQAQHVRVLRETFQTAERAALQKEKTYREDYQDVCEAEEELSRAIKDVEATKARKNHPGAFTELALAEVRKNRAQSRLITARQVADNSKNYFDKASDEMAQAYKTLLDAQDA